MFVQDCVGPECSEGERQGVLAQFSPSIDRSFSFCAFDETPRDDISKAQKQD